MWHNYQSVTGQTLLSNNSAPNDESQLMAANLKQGNGFMEARPPL